MTEVDGPGKRGCGAGGPDKPEVGRLGPALASESAGVVPINSKSCTKGRICLGQCPLLYASHTIWSTHGLPSVLVAYEAIVELPRSGRHLHLVHSDFQQVQVAVAA